MYVLPHADRPEAYSGLPRDPTIAASVAAWKGPMKPVGLALLGLTTIGAFIHYLKYGRKEIEHESAAGGERDQRGEV
jgi:formate dehydrogenase iron-sulfur subunit